MIAEQDRLHAIELEDHEFSIKAAAIERDNAFKRQVNGVSLFDNVGRLIRFVPHRDQQGTLI